MRFNPYAEPVGTRSTRVPEPTPAPAPAPVAPVAAVCDRRPSGADTAPLQPCQVTVTVNDHGAIEIRFAAKPDEAVRKQLGREGMGFRWSGKRLCWYHKHTPENWAFAQSLLPKEADRITGLATLPPSGPSGTDNIIPVAFTPARPSLAARLLQRRPA